nr:hypothetical protein [Allomuricauda sp.]
MSRPVSPYPLFRLEDVFNEWKLILSDTKPNSNREQSLTEFRKEFDNFFVLEF